MATITPKTYIYAHRGASGYAPENTLEAFALAAEMKADGVELDVHFSKDGKVVVIHDDKIDRVSNAQGKVKEYTLDELLAFDFGYKFYGERRGIKIPTLDQVYELLAPTGMTVNVEIKASDPAICASCLEIAKKYGMEKKVIYSSFDHFQIARIKELDPSVFIAPLYSFNMVRPWDYCQNLRAKATHPAYTQIQRLPDYVEKCHALGIRVHTWTTNDEESMKLCFDADCDAIITNFPDVALKLRDEK